MNTPTKSPQLPDATGNFTARCHVCPAHTEYRDGKRIDLNCPHILGRAYSETDLSLERVRAFLNVWKGHPSTSPQIVAIYSGRKGEGYRFSLLVRDLSLLLDAAEGVPDRPATS